MTPRNYQQKAITTIVNGFNNATSRVVLASATGSGKTEMAIMIAADFINSGKGKVLVVAHHTNIIKSNFIQRLQEVAPGFTFSDNDLNADCFVTIRSNALSVIEPSQFGLVIVDEAHHNYFAKTIQEFVKSIPHQVLLTATPSKFVAAGGFDILPIARLDIPNEFFAQLNFCVVNADNKLSKDDYNDDGNVKVTTRMTKSEMQSAVDAAMAHLVSGKQLFITRNINAARQVATYLTSLGIVTSISTSDNDADGQIADSFKAGQLDSLVVVDRMRLGYSDNSLFNTIDLTFTHNPDTIHQMMARSNRGNQSQSKMFIKVTNDKLNLHTRLTVSVAIALMKADNLIAFNGRNLDGVKIPVIRNSGSGSSNGSSAAQQLFTFSCVDNLFDQCDFVYANDVLNLLSGRISHSVENCINLFKENCKTKAEFQSMFKAQYNWMYRHNLINDFYTALGFNDDRYTKCVSNFKQCKDLADFKSKFASDYTWLQTHNEYANFKKDTGVGNKKYDLDSLVQKCIDNNISDLDTFKKLFNTDYLLTSRKGLMIELIKKANLKISKRTAGKLKIS